MLYVQTMVCRKNRTIWYVPLVQRLRNNVKSNVNILRGNIAYLTVVLTRICDQSDESAAEISAHTQSKPVHHKTLLLILYQRYHNLVPEFSRIFFLTIQRIEMKVVRNLSFCLFQDIAGHMLVCSDINTEWPLFLDISLLVSYRLFVFLFIGRT